MKVYEYVWPWFNVPESNGLLVFVEFDVAVCGDCPLFVQVTVALPDFRFNVIGWKPQFGGVT